MLEKKIEICIGTDRNRGVRVRLSLLLVLDGTIISEHYHSITILPGQDLIQIRNRLDSHLQTQDSGIPAGPWPPIPDKEWHKVEEVIKVIHTS